MELARVCGVKAFHMGKRGDVPAMLLTLDSCIVSLA